LLQGGVVPIIAPRKNRHFRMRGNSRIGASTTVEAMLRVHESETTSGRQWVWTLCRNCALTPRQVGAFYLSLVAASAVIATVFLLRGAWMILPFSVLEMTALGVALLIYARHAVDRERVALDRDALEIESIHGNEHRVLRFDPRVTRVEMDARPKAELAVVARGQRVLLGRFVDERERRRFARQLRTALASAA
jgi:uncharacterized membrane protein